MLSVSFPVFWHLFLNFPLLRHHILVFLILLHKFWSLTWTDRLFPLLNFLHNFSNFFLQFFWLILFNPWELCLFLKYFYVSLFFFIHFPVFLTQVYRFYGNFSVFHFFHLFSAFLFYATAFLLNFIDYFPENVISDFSWIAAYISRVCSHLFLQVWCVIILALRRLFAFNIFVRYLLFYIRCFGFWHKSIDIFAIC